MSIGFKFSETEISKIIQSGGLNNQKKQYYNFLKERQKFCK